MNETFHQELQRKIEVFAHGVYAATRSFPKEERYGITSQLRRAALSVALNTVEGYARGKKLVYLNFLETAYGSLKEVMYLVRFSAAEGLLDPQGQQDLQAQADGIGKMLWGTMRGLRAVK